MADIFSPEKRSWIMSRIRSKNTKIDLSMKRMLEENGLAYIMYPSMFGSPDFILKEKQKFPKDTSQKLTCAWL